MGDPAIKAALKEATWTLARPHPGDAQQHVAAAIAAFLRALLASDATPSLAYAHEWHDLAAKVEAAAHD